MKDYVSFDVGYRVGSFVEFRDESQFKSAAAQLADRAASEVARYRAMFANIGKTCEYFLRQDITTGWPSYHAGIAFALANKVDAARSLLAKFAEPRDSNNEFYAAAQDEAKGLVPLVGTPRFREVITDKVRQTREIRKLQSLASISLD